MGVGGFRKSGSSKEQPSGHPQVQHSCVRAKGKKEVLAAATDLLQASFCELFTPAVRIQRTTQSNGMP